MSPASWRHALAAILALAACSAGSQAGWRAESCTVVAGGNGPGNGPGQLNSPRSVAAGAQGVIYVSDGDNDRVLECTAPGVCTTLAGNLPWAWDLVVQGSRLLVGSGDKVYDLSGAPGSPPQIVAPGSQGGVGLTVAAGIAVGSDGTLFVADRDRDEITAWVGGVGTVIDAYDNPEGLAVDAAGDLYIVETTYNFVWKLYKSSNWSAGAAVAGHGDEVGGAGLDELDAPSGLALDESGRIFLADTGNDRVAVWVPDADAGMEADLAGTVLSEPKGVAFDEAGNLLIADTGNHRVLRCEPPRTSTSSTTTAMVTATSSAASTATATATPSTTPMATSISLAESSFSSDVTASSTLSSMTMAPSLTASSPGTVGTESGSTSGTSMGSEPTSSSISGSSTSSSSFPGVATAIESTAAGPSTSLPQEAGSSAGLTGAATSSAAEASLTTSPSAGNASIPPAAVPSSTTQTSTSLPGVLQTIEEAMQQRAMDAVVSLDDGFRTAVNATEGLLTVISVDRMLAVDRPGDFQAAANGTGEGVSLPRPFLRALPLGSTVVILRAGDASGNVTEELATDPFARVAGGRLATPSLSIAIYNARFRKVEKLPEPLFFKLPPGLGSWDAGREEARCVFLKEEGKALRWSTRGVRRATAAEVEAQGYVHEGVWCRTEHLSVFAAVLRAILTCTNVELFTEEGASAVKEHEGWWRTRSSGMFFSAVGILLALTAAGCAWEAWALRLGRTSEPGSRVKLCKMFFSFGPHMLKHKYAAFVVYAGDLLHCLRRGPAKLRLPTLTAAVQRSFAVKTGVSNACVAQHCWNGGSWVDTPASLPHAVLCHKLAYYAGGAEEVIEHELRGRRTSDRLHRFFISFLALHPLLDAVRLGAGSLSVGKRMAMQLASFVGVLATNAIIFNFAGERSWEADGECPISTRSYLFIAVASLASVLISVLPNQFLADLAKQVHGRPFWNAAFWCLCLSYMLVATAVVVLALANLNSRDQEKWHRTIEFTTTIKFLGMPAMQALRISIMLEHFLWEDAKSRHIETSMCLKDPNEKDLDPEEVEVVETMARRVISAAELVRFASLLGSSAVMPEYDPEKSSTGDVIDRAVSLFSEEQLAEAYLTVEALELRGMAGADGSSLSCSVLHLGRQERSRRPVISAVQSEAVPASAHGPTCRWRIQASLPDVELDHALGFTISEGGRPIGVAHLPVAALLQGGSCELPVHQPEGGGPRSGAFAVPAAPRCVAHELNASRGCVSSGARCSQQARLLVEVEVPKECMHALVRQELSKLKRDPPLDQSEVREHLPAPLLRQEGVARPPGGSYCEPVQPGGLPPERIVVHSHAGNFRHLVSVLLADALDEEGAIDVVAELLRERDFSGLLDLLKQRGCHERRFWMDMFAMETGAGTEWHERLLSALPQLLRLLKQQCAGRMASDLRARLQPACGLPVQLLVLDSDFCVLQDSCSIAEVQLAKSMSFPQRVLLHPEQRSQLHVLEALRRLSKPREKCPPWTRPYLQHRAAVASVAALVIKAAREEELEGVESLSMDDFAMVVGVNAAQIAGAGRKKGDEEGEVVTDLDTTAAGDGD